jgi:hypothetical protein
MVVIVPNSQPYRQPVAFLPSGVANALYHQNAVTNQAMAVGKLVQALTNGTARLADAVQGIEANGVVVMVQTANRIKWSAVSQIWLPLTGATTAGEQPLYTGEAGAVVTAPPEGGFEQQVGFASNYDAATDEYFCGFEMRRPLADVLAGLFVVNTLGGAVEQGFIYGKNGGVLAKAQSGGSSVRPDYLALRDTANGERIPVAVHGRYRVKVETVKTYTVGAFLWVSQNTPGTVTDIRPTARFFLVGTAAATTVDADGMLLVDTNIQMVGSN